ncbi:TPA: hypothetical protein N2951_001215 [Vibrio parahaemolyticus]|nr:hypothetical protein [Vibrio parahaemolyticus]
MNKIFPPFKLNSSIELSHRIIMAPMNRCKAEKLIPTDAMVDYSAKCADVRLVITEGVIISPVSQGHPNVTGINTGANNVKW